MKITELTLEFAKNYLRVDYDNDDVLIQMMIDSAMSYIQSFLNQKFADFEEVPTEFTIAALSLIIQWYEQRSIAAESNAHEQLYSFTGLLDQQRKFIDEGEA